MFNMHNNKLITNNPIRPKLIFGDKAIKQFWDVLANFKPVKAAYALSSRIKISA